MKKLRAATLTLVALFALATGLILVTGFAILNAAPSYANEPANVATSAKQNSGTTPDDPIRIGVVDAEEAYWATFTEAARAEGIYVLVQNFGDYTLINQALVEGDLELNQFQHLDFLANFNVASGSDLVPIGATATYPMALFSDRWGSVADIPDGAEIAVPNDPTNLARALLVLQDAGLLMLADGGSFASTAYDVLADQSRVSVIAVDAAQTAASIHDLDGAIVNNDMIGQIGLTLQDAIYADNPNSAASAPYINIFVARAADADNPTFARLVEIFHTPAVINGLQEANAHSAVIANTPPAELMQILVGLETERGGAGLRGDAGAGAGAGVAETPGTPAPVPAEVVTDYPPVTVAGSVWDLVRLILPLLLLAGLLAFLLYRRRTRLAVGPGVAAASKPWEDEVRPATGAVGVVRPDNPSHTGIPIISFQHVSKIFPATKRREETRAVDDVTFDILQGEVFAVIGYSGAGKSTLVRLINGLERPSSGKVIVDGVPISGLSENGLRPVRQDIGMVFQSFNLLQSRTVAGNIAYPLEIAGMPKAERKARVAELLDYVGLSSMAGAYPNQLSGGQRQRVGIARALATNPKILLADEATSALDPETTQDVLRLLDQINKDLGITIVVITHSMSVVRFLCDRVAVMEHGKVAEIGDVYSVFGAPNAEITQRFVGTALADRPTDEVMERLRSRHPGRLISVNVREGGTKQFNRIFAHHKVDAEVVFGGITEVGARPVGALTLEIVGPPDRVEAAAQQMLALAGGEDYGTANAPAEIVVPAPASGGRTRAVPARPMGFVEYLDDATDVSETSDTLLRGAPVEDVIGDGTVLIVDDEGNLR